VLTDTRCTHRLIAAGKHERLEMQSTMMTLVRQRGCAPKTFTGTAGTVRIGLAGPAMTAVPASTFVGGADSSLQQQLKQNNQIAEVVVRRRGVARRTTVVWRPGGAIAAGAAIGFVTAAMAAAWAARPPSLATAGTTPIRVGRRVAGTSARNNAVQGSAP
jgi:hypothetical protein